MVSHVIELGDDTVAPMFLHEVLSVTLDQLWLTYRLYCDFVDKVSCIPHKDSIANYNQSLQRVEGIFVYFLDICLA